MRASLRGAMMGMCLLALPITPAAATFPGANGSVAYYDFAFSPVVEWSPDGSRKAFQDSSGLLVATNANGGGRTVLYDLSAHGYSGFRGFGWSADAAELVIAPYTSCGPSCSPKSDLLVIGADGTGERRITDTPSVSEEFPEWSPDGSKIAFGRDGVISTIKPDGTGPQSLRAGQFPSWSPDQGKLAYARIACWHPEDENCFEQIFVMDADGSDSQLIVPSDCQIDWPCTNTTPIWSPDGSKIAFASDRYGGFGDTDILMMNRDGTGQRFFTGDPTFEDYMSDWQAIPVRYARPKGATPFEVSLVPAYRPCTGTINSTHGPPLAYNSCAPPRQVSSRLTVGTPDANGQRANASGFVRYDTLVGDPATPADEADVAVYVVVRDVRNGAGLSDYTGELQVTSDLRITDRDNTPYPGGAGPGTAQDGRLPATVTCAGTPDPATGSVCTLATSMDALSPGVVKEGRRALWQLGQVHVYDGGADGLAATEGDNEVFMNAGVFVP